MTVITAVATILALLGAVGARVKGSPPRRWISPQNGHAIARPVIDDGVLYTETEEGTIIARDAETGRVRWTSRIARTASPGPLAARAGLVFVPTAYATVALDARTGLVRWRFESPDGIEGAVSAPGYVGSAQLDADDATVFVPAWGASVSAVDARTGMARWVWRPARDVRFRIGASGVRVSGDTVFVAMWHFRDALGLRSEPWLVALDRARGTELWRAVLTDYPSGGVCALGAPALGNGVAIITARGGDAWAVDRANGRTLWYSRPHPAHATLAAAELADSLVYVDGGNDSLYALRASNGSVLWHVAIEGPANGPVLIADGRVYVSNGPALLEFDRETGKALSRREPDIALRIEAPFGPPVADAHHVFVAVLGAVAAYPIIKPRL